MRVRLTTAKLAKLPLGITRDDEVRGLFVDVGKTGASYKIQGTLYPSKESVRRTIGRVGDISLDDARQEARRLLAAIRNGKVPPTRKERICEDTTYSLRWAYEQQNASQLKRGKGEAHANECLANLRRHLSDWADRPMDELTPLVVNRLHTDIGEKAGKHAANNTMRQLKAALNRGWKLRGEMRHNPVDGIDWFATAPAENHALPDDKWPWFWDATAALGSSVRRDFHRMLFLTGLRPLHLKQMKCEWVDFDRRCISHPKLKSGRPFDLPMSELIAGIVRDRIEQSWNEFIFPARSKSGHLDVHREKALHPYTGKAGRQTYISIINSLPIDPVHRHCLTDHSVPGIQGTYASDKILFPKLLEAQDMVSSAILLHVGQG